MEKSGCLAGMGVLAAGYAVGVGTSTIVGATFSGWADVVMTTGEWIAGAGFGFFLGGIAGLVLAALGGVILLTSDKGRSIGDSVLWAAINAVYCGAVTFLICMFLNSLPPHW